MQIKVMTDFDGACPHSASGLKQTSEGITFFPNTRREPGLGEEMPGKGSRFSTRLLNSGHAAQNINLTVDWDTDQRTEHHDLGYMRHETETEWRMIAGRRAGARVTYQICLSPGLTHLGLYPEYNYEQLTAFTRRLKKQTAKVTVAGKSQEKRPIYLITIPSPNPDAIPFLLQARDHAYETAGSYAVEGMVDFLLSADPLALYLKEKFLFHFLPMTNPDGVYNGMSQRTWERGPRMDNVFDIPDHALQTVKQTVDKLKPGVYLSLHNWTLKFTDGLLYGRHSDAAEAFLRFMPADVAHHKHWLSKPLGYVELKQRGIVDLTAYVQRQGKPASENPIDVATNLFSQVISHWVIYCEELYNAVGLAIELPWFSLNTAEMREKGKKVLIAAALAVIETRKL